MATKKTTAKKSSRRKARAKKTQKKSSLPTTRPGQSPLTKTSHKKKNRKNNARAKKVASPKSVTLEEQILSNIARCTQTIDAEKVKLRELVQKEFSKIPKGTPDAEISRAISTSLSAFAISSNQFFKGKLLLFNQSGLVWNAKHLEHLSGLLQRAILEEYGESMAIDDARLEAKLIIDELADPENWSEAVRKYATLPLHIHGFPFWLADPKSGKPPPTSTLPYYPARAGLKQDGIPNQKYLILRLRIPNDSTQPRFIDSCGYQYWRPGGVTAPLDHCPAEMSGFTEAVTDRVILGHISAEPHVINRVD